MSVFDDGDQLKDRIERLEEELVAARSPYSIFDKHGSLAIVLAIFIQTAGAIWWAAGISSEVDELKSSSSQRDVVLSSMNKVIQDNAERLTRVQTVQESVVKILDELSRREMRGPNQ